MTARVIVLGTAQDGGLPHAGCTCTNCETARADPAHQRLVASVAVVGTTGRVLLVDATPDLPRQWAHVLRATGRPPDALLLTHAHIGHYLGLAWLGREGMNTERLPVFATSSMRTFLHANRPWSHLVTRGQIAPKPIRPGDAIDFDGLAVVPFRSPHRAEDTDTVGLDIQGPTQCIVYLSDGDRLPDDVVDRIRAADVALVDGTFYSPDELPGRDISEILHPFIAESVERLEGAGDEIYFTHLNHSNPLLDPDPAKRPVLPEPFQVVAEGAVFPL